MKHEQDITLDAAVCFAALVGNEISRFKLLVKKRFNLGEQAIIERSLWFQTQPFEYQSTVTQYMLAQMLSVPFTQIEADMKAETNAKV